ncbi:hypothetical protein DAEQUDRAFT_287299 [Daedalea quercina L-15889]|uniref:Uncharacterized protein n=1 Tax=Daedalea quercina L-15889 TaxID=1314783 RepID=A0A165TWH7_9APHY|nr:hypothetical protein DAEQUDRAFT_287299 [Daedalea quercina L-15889]
MTGSRTLGTARIPPASRHSPLRTPLTTNKHTLQMQPHSPDADSDRHRVTTSFRIDLEDHTHPRYSRPIASDGRIHRAIRDSPARHQRSRSDCASLMSMQVSGCSTVARCARISLGARYSSSTLRGAGTAVYAQVPIAVLVGAWPTTSWRPQTRSCPLQNADRLSRRAKASPDALRVICASALRRRRSQCDLNQEDMTHDADRAGGRIEALGRCGTAI